MAAVPAAVAPASAADLFALLHKSGLFRPDVLDQKLGEFEFPPDAAGAAATLVRAGLLTPFQSRLLLAGKYRGFKLGTYLIRDQIGRGGMGTVYLAEHATLRRKVALKVLAAEGAMQKAGVERFLREARAAAALDHPNIVKVFDVLQSGELHYIVLEYVDGKTLDQLVQGGGAMAPGRAVTYISQAAAGLQHAFEKGFVHRDIKPGNLIVAKDGTLKILDMGLARSLVDDGDRVTEVLDEGAVVGTADYISPEQATNQPGVDIRADIYSLGATLFALITGQPPFTGSTSQVLMQHQLKAPPSLADYDRTIAPGLAAVVAKMLAKKSADRYHTPAEVIAALAPWLPNRDGAQKVMAGLSTSELGRNSGTLQNTLDQVLSSSTRNLPRPDLAPPAKSRRGLWIGVGSAFAAVAALLGGYLFLMRGPGDEVRPPVATPAGSGPPGSVAAKPAAAKPAAPKPVASKTATRPAVARPAVARPAAKPLYALDLSAQQPFTDRGRTGGDWNWQTTAKTGAGSLPAGWKGFHWSHEAEGEYFADADGGRPALGMRTLTGKGSAMLLAPPVKLTGPVPVTVEYRSEPGSGAVFQVRFVQTAPTKEMAADVTDLPPTGGEWKTATFTLDPKAAAEGFVEFHNHELGAGHAIRLRGLSIGGGEPAVAGRPTLFRLDVASLPEFQIALTKSGATSKLPAEMPAGSHTSAFRDGGTGELVRTTVDGAPALGIGSRAGGEASAQLVWPLPSEEFDPEREYALRVTHLAKGDVGGLVIVQNLSKSYAKLAEVRIDPAAAGWQTTEVTFRRPAGAEIKVAFQSLRQGADGDMAYVRAVEVFDPAGVKPLFRLDPADLAAFQHRVRNRARLSGTDASFPAGVGTFAWKPETEAEFANEPVDGRPALRLTNLSGPVSAQLMLNMEMPENGMGLTLTPDTRYELRGEYKTSGGAVGRTYTQGADYKETFDGVALPDTGGEWRAFTYSFTRGAVPLRLLIDLDAVGAAKSLYLRAIELVPATGDAAPPAAPPPPPAAAPMAVGAKVSALDLSALPTFKGQIADGQYAGEYQRFHPGVSWGCYKKTSVAEFRGEPTDAGPALGVTNLNDPVSSQVYVPLDSAPGSPGLKADQRYVLRVEYRTTNDAAGELQIRRPDFKAIAQSPLPATGGGWKWAEVSFTRPDGVKLEALLNNKAVGEGNTLWLRAAELFEAK